MPQKRPSVFVLPILCCICLRLLGGAATPWLALFGSDDCESCGSLKARWAESYPGVVLVYVCIDREENYAYLKELEEALGVSGKFNAFPLAAADGRIVGSMEEIDELACELSSGEAGAVWRLPLVAPMQAAADAADGAMVAWNAPVSAGVAGTQAGEGGRVARRAPRLLYLSTPGCQKCARQEVELRLLQERLPSLEVSRYEITTEEGQVMAARARLRFGLKEDGANLAPLVAWQDGYVTGELATAERLADELSSLEKRMLSPEGGAGDGGARPVVVKGGADPFWLPGIAKEELEAVGGENHGFLERMTITATLLAGLADGINPCAFATVIFLISYLLYLKRGRRFVLVTGLLFCLGVFGSYLLFGVGVSYIVDYLNRFAVVKRVFYWGFAVVGAVLGALHLRDALRFRRSGQVSEMEMGLNAGAHRRIHDRIHSWGRLAGWVAMPATVLLGVVVSAMEFVCTGQIYLPTIVAINSAGFDLGAFRGLLIYNTAFILPLVAVTLLAYWGVGAKALARFAKDHVFGTKILMTALFLLLAALMAALGWNV